MILSQSCDMITDWAVKLPFTLYGHYDYAALILVQVRVCVCLCACVYDNDCECTYVIEDNSAAHIIRNLYCEFACVHTSDFACIRALYFSLGTSFYFTDWNVTDRYLDIMGKYGTLQQRIPFVSVKIFLECKWNRPYFSSLKQFHTDPRAWY